MSAVVWCIAFLWASIVSASLRQDRDLKTGAQLVGARIDYLVSTLEDEINNLQRTDIALNDNLLTVIDKWKKAITRPDNPIYPDVVETGSFQNRGDLLAANTKLRDTVKAFFEMILEDETLDPMSRAVVHEILARLANEPEGYSPAGVITAATAENRGTDIDPSEREADIKKGFRYYGKPYNLETETYPDERGFLVFSETSINTADIDLDSLDPETNMPAMLTPYMGYGGDGENGFAWYHVMFSGVDEHNPSYRQYTWMLGPGNGYLHVANGNSQEYEPVKTAVKLYTNDWIVFDYYQEPGAMRWNDAYNGGEIDGYLPGGFAGLLPGDGQPGSGHPGEGVARDWNSGIGDLWRAYKEGRYNPLYYYNHYTDNDLDYWGNPIPYVAVTNEICEGPSPMPLDVIYVFRTYHWLTGDDYPEPVYDETGKRYSITAVTRNLMVDPDTVDRAINGIYSKDGYFHPWYDVYGLDTAENPDQYILRKIDHGDTCYRGIFEPGYFSPKGTWNNSGYTFWQSGAYEYGLQTVGQDGSGNPELFIHAFLDAEDDLEMLNNDGFAAYMVQAEEDYVNRAIIDRARNSAEIEARIASYWNLGYSDIRARDAAMVEKADAQAGRVLKDIHGNWVRVQQYILRPDPQTVQMLNVCLRGGDGPYAGISSMDFTTTFANEGGYGLDRDLRDLPWHQWLATHEGEGRFVVNNHEFVELNTMSVELTNPGNESLKEERTFGELKPYGLFDSMQPIIAEQLTLNHSAEYDYTAGGPPGTGEYRVQTMADPTNPHYGEFYYELGGEDSHIFVAMHKVSDYDEDPEKIDYIKDIWDALRVNEMNSPYIGSNNLEITVDGDRHYFNEPIDIVYIPMSRMLWKDKGNRGTMPD